MSSSVNAIIIIANLDKMADPLDNYDTSNINSGIFSNIIVVVIVVIIIKMPPPPSQLFSITSPRAIDVVVAIAVVNVSVVSVIIAIFTIIFAIAANITTTPLIAPLLPA